MMLDHAGLPDEAAARLEAAVARVYRDGKALTPDQGGNGTTKGLASAVLAALKNGSRGRPGGGRLRASSALTRSRRGC